MRDDRADPLYKVLTFYVPSSSDGYGFKVYQNQNNKDVVVQFKGHINGGRMSKFENINLSSLSWGYFFEL